MSLNRLGTYLKKFDMDGGLDFKSLPSKFPKLTFTKYSTFGQLFNSGTTQEHYDYSMYVRDVSGTERTLHYRQYTKYHDCHSYLR